MILLAVDPRTIYHCRSVSTTFRATIEGSFKIRCDLLFLKPSRPALSIDRLLEHGSERRYKACARYSHGSDSQPAPAKYNEILLVGPSWIERLPLKDVKRRLLHKLLFYSANTRLLRFPVDLERLGLGVSNSTGSSPPYRFESLQLFPFPEMQLSSPPAQNVIFYGSSGTHLFDVYNPAGVDYSNVVSGLRSYARKTLEVGRQRPNSCSKQQRLKQWSSSLDQELRNVSVRFSDVSEIDDEEWSLIWGAIRSSGAGAVQLRLLDAIGITTSWNVQRHMKYSDCCT